jgi:UDP-N-acetyl-D-mannosaminuronic acid dehydrogenase
MKALQKRIKNKSVKIAVIGLGYVGLPVGCLLAKAGFKVIGINRGQEKVDLINQGVSPIEGKEPGLNKLVREMVNSKQLKATTDYKICKEADVFIIAVETPVDSTTHIPRYKALKSALKSLGPHLRKGSLVIIESTIAPGTTENVVAPLLEKKSGLKLNKDFYLGHCPERVMPGKLLHNLKNYHRVIGGSTPETSKIMYELYKTYVKGDLDQTDVATAEVVKTTENYYRDVEIAFANQLALVCEQFGVNVHESRKLVNKVESRNIHTPGAGVGGHCIPKDGYLNVSFLRGKGNSDARVALEMADLSRKINDFMPSHTANLLTKSLREKGRSISNSRVVVLGYSYLANSDDTRNSPTQIFIESLKGKSKNIVVQDPFVKEYKNDLNDVLQNADAVVLMVAHDQYKKLDLGKLRKMMRTPILIDGRGIFDKEEAKKFGFIYKGIGNV